MLRFLPNDTHDPDRAAQAVPARQAAVAWPRPEADEPPLRPLILIEPPEPIETTAGVPDSPPARFQWRQTVHEVAHAEGPERIGPEWWRSEQAAPTRDYFRVEDREGRRFWVFRSGLYEDGSAAPAWFMHGLFS